MKANHGGLEILLGARGIGDSYLDKFRDAGFTSASDVGRKTPEELEDQVDGIGYSTAVSVLKHLEKEGLRQDDTRDKELERLIELLRDLFEFGAEDRDFGVYKLMNANRGQIEEFLKTELIETIEDEVATIVSEFEGKTQEEARDEVLNELGTDEFFDENNEPTQRAQQLIEEETSGVSQDELENIRAEIYNDIYQFFNTYYEHGDFMTKRKRSHHEEPYSIPYDGSNTHFHWVTRNQYYAKTSEQFTRFTFNHQNYKYHFQTQDGEVNGDGIGNSEYFVMADPSNLEVGDDSLHITFYRRMIDDEDIQRCGISANTHNKQDAMNTAFADELATKLRNHGIPFNRETIEAKIDEYTTRNQNDFFIHKHLERFLFSELEEYVKSEIVTYKPATGTESLNEISMEKGRVVNEISTKIIKFLGQIEEFKRNLFEKKKFVTNSYELTPLSEIDADHYETILENKIQRIQWEESYKINTNTLSPAKLEQTPYNRMLVDTSLFNENFTSNIPNNTLIKGENYQALSFLQDKYENSVKAIYIDPPYNTGSANFAYKDSYQRPTWLSMMHDRINVSHSLLEEDGVIFIHIDDNEVENLRRICDEVFGEENRLAQLIWDLGASSTSGHFKQYHEYILCYAKDKQKLDYFDFDIDLEYVRTQDSETISERAIKKISDKNPPSEITLPEGIEIRGVDDAVFTGEIGSGSEKIYIKDDELRFKDGQLASDTTLEAGWAMKDQILEWINDEGTVYDSKGQEILGFYFNKNGKLQYEKVRETMHPPTILDFPSTKRGTNELEDIIGRESPFDFPKPKEIAKNLLGAVTDDEDTIIDFFSGSGTTAQAVMEINKDLDKNLNYVLVELLDEAFEITQERIRRLSYANEWNDGDPQPNSDTSYSPPSIECIELESYEQALDAVRFNQETTHLGEFQDTLLNYWLELGTKDSPVFLDTDQLTTPTKYTLNLEYHNQPIDVMTTFNYLVGMKNISRETTTIAGVDYTLFNGTHENTTTLVIWRHNANEVDYEAEKEQLAPNDYDTVYINGDSAIENSRPISQEFSQKLSPSNTQL